VQRIDWARCRVETLLNGDQVRACPDIDTDKPICRQHEMEFFSYYGFPVYWGGPYLWGGTPYPTIAADSRTHVNEPSLAGVEAPADLHLRSLVQIDRYELQATDGPMGHVCGFLVEEISWAIRRVVVDTGHWMAGRQVSVATQCITGMEWAAKIMKIQASQNEVRRSPEYDAALEFSHGVEETFFPA